MLPWAAALYQQRRDNLEKGHPSERCIGHGVTDYDAAATLRRIIQTPGIIAILFESYNHYRQIFLDGRPLPQPTQPSYMGYSVGKWEGDTLVIDTTGLNDKGWLDMHGHPQTESTATITCISAPTYVLGDCSLPERLFGETFHFGLEKRAWQTGSIAKPWTTACRGVTDS